MKYLDKQGHKVWGFTLIELLVVLAVISLLLTLALPKYFHSIESAKDRILAENLRNVRDTISKFHADKGRYPNSLNELVDLKYLSRLPTDPVTEQEFIIIAPSKGVKGQIFDIKTSAQGFSKIGKAYADF